MRDLLTSVEQHPSFEDFDLMLQSILSLTNKDERKFERKQMRDVLDHS